MSKSTTTTPALTTAESAAQERDETARETAQKILAAYERTAEIRAGVPARLAELEQATFLVLSGFDQRIAVADAASFDDAPAISDGLLAGVQRSKYIASRDADRTALLAQIEREVAAVNEGVPSLNEFFLAVYKAQFAALLQLLFPFCREDGDASELALKADAVVIPLSRARDARSGELPADFFLDRLKLYVAGEIEQAWRI